MKIEIVSHYGKHICSRHWCYKMIDLLYNSEEYDYMFKYLDFDKLDKNVHIWFNNKETSNHIDSDWLNNIYKKQQYKYIKDNWGKGLFRINIYYLDKQGLKSIVNRIINVMLRHEKKHED